MTFKVSFRPLAVEDLRNLHNYIAQQSGPAAAAGYIDRIEAACLALSQFPRRGRPRDDIRAGLRTLAFERRVLIVYDIRGKTVRILSILYGGRDFAGMFGP